MHIKLADAVTRQETIDVGVRPALHARKCDGCGTIFKMEQFSSGDQHLGELHVTFNNTYGTNIALLDVCSFRCAHDLFTGGWREMPGFKHFADADNQIVRADLKITSLVLSEALIRSKWESTDYSDVNKRHALDMPSSEPQH